MLSFSGPAIHFANTGKPIAWSSSGDEALNDIGIHEYTDYDIVALYNDVWEPIKVYTEPTLVPTLVPTLTPTSFPSEAPSETEEPTSYPTSEPTLFNHDSIRRRRRRLNFSQQTDHLLIVVPNVGSKFMKINNADTFTPDDFYSQSLSIYCDADNCFKESEKR